MTPHDERHATATAPAWHILSTIEVATELKSDLQRGLAGSEAAARLLASGPNTLAQAKQRSTFTIFIHQFRSLIVGLLLGADAVALFLEEYPEALAILLVLALNTAIGFFTEWRAARALEGLRKQAVATARVLRDGNERQIPASDLVAGDLVRLTGGDRVPADGRIVDQAQLQVDEAALTGESTPVVKSADPIADAKATLAERESMIYLGSLVSAGRGDFLVTATGAQTEWGKIGNLIANVDEPTTPLELKLAQLSRALLLIVLVLCMIIVGIGWLRGNALLAMVRVGVSLAIAAVPEGLLAVTTMILAVGMQRMATMNALVRRLPVVESLGSTTVICSDKTGTLTRNEMTVCTYAVASRHVEVTGLGYAIAGEFRIDGQRIDPVAGGRETPLLQILRAGALCNDAKLERGDGDTRVLGDPTEAALIVAAEKAGLDLSALTRDYPRIAELPFSAQSMKMVTVHKSPSGKTFAYVKGSPAAVLAGSVAALTATQGVPLSEAIKAQVLADNEVLANAALRVLGLAYREVHEPHTDDDLARELTFLGLVGMSDPLRTQAVETVAICRSAGIRVVMITGDQQATASAIARQLGLDTDAEGRPLQTVHARELEGLTPQAWTELVQKTAVFARVAPEQKLQLVQTFQKLGHVVAMTGDGVNDAPALRQADIGVAMGIRGSEIAKESAAMVITDDNFATIVGAIAQGRVIVRNILRFIHYLFSCNLAEILTMFAAVMIGWPLPLGVLQLLWLNLVTDVFPAMALALEPAPPEVMQRPPRDPRQPLLTPSFGWLIVWQGGLLAASSLVAFGIGLRKYGIHGQEAAHAASLAFMTLAIAQIFHVFNARSRRRSAFGSRLFTNGWLWAATAVCLLLQVATVSLPGLRDLLRLTPLNAADWGVVGVCSLAPVVVVEAVKLVSRLVRPSR